MNLANIAKRSREPKMSNRSHARLPIGQEFRYSGMSKKLIFIFILFTFHFCKAGTGSAYDGQFFILAIIAFLLSIAFVIFIISFIRKRIRRRKESLPFEENTQEPL
jgi:hypothetical protein